jgi:hypothetical protein
MTKTDRYLQALELAHNLGIYHQRVYRRLPNGGRSATRYYKAHSYVDAEKRFISYTEKSAAEAIEKVAAELEVALLKNGKRLTRREIDLIKASMPNLNVADYLRVKREGNVLTLVHRHTNTLLKVPVAL